MSREANVDQPSPRVLLEYENRSVQSDSKWLLTAKVGHERAKVNAVELPMATVAQRTSHCQN